MMTNNFSFIVHSWMMTSLGLKGNELIAYAIVYKYSDIIGQELVVSIRELAEIMNVGKNTAQSVLDSLVEKGLIFKEKSVITCYNPNSYRVDLKMVEEIVGSESGTIPKMVNVQKARKNKALRQKLKVNLSPKMGA